MPHPPTGILVPVDDVQALSDAIARLCQDQPLRRQLGQNARAFIEQSNLTWDRTAAQFEDIFLRTIAR
jgi:glycosyltransferase involved in cell wall biosynthesis